MKSGYSEGEAFDPIPRIDLSALLQERSSDYFELVEEFGRVFSTIGFALVVNHGIPSSLVDRVFEASRQFHGLPIETKMSLELNHLHRGYIPINTSTDVNSKFENIENPNQSASFMMMREDSHQDPSIFLSGPNQWPSLEGFRETLETYHRSMKELGFQLMKLAVLSFGAEPDEILDAFHTPTTWLRLLHYPSRSGAFQEGIYGSAPHLDFGCLTLLAQDEVGGLQVLSQEEEWVDVPYIADSFVLNVGEMLQRLSNGFLIPTPHRVINPENRERYSCPFFYDPHVNTVIKPLKGTGNPKFKPIMFSEFLENELKAGYLRHQTEA